MYTFSNRLKIGSFILMALGILGMSIGFMSVPTTVEEAKMIVAAHDDGHGESHAVEDEHAAESEHAVVSDHDASHDEHVLHQLQNMLYSLSMITS